LLFIKTVKRVVEKAGGRYRAVRQVFGPNPNAISSIAEFDDWNGLAKMRSDPEMQQLRARILQNASPAADAIAGILVEDIPV